MEKFLKELEELDTKDLKSFCRKRVLHGCPFVFSGREDDYYDFRKIIADNFDANFYEIYIIGSAMLGFNPRKKTEFSLDSDIDVAIVSNRLFDEVMDNIYLYQLQLRKNRRVVSVRELEQYHKFLEYTALGWIRPDLLPSSFKINDLKDGWFDFFQSISNGKSNVGNYKVAGGVFKSYEYLERYLVDGYEELKNELALGEKDG